jgi:cytochrome c-type biogenesis protein CcmI
MGLMIGLLTLPLAPVRGVAWIAEQVQTEAERQWSDPTFLQAQLMAVQEQREAGEIDDAEADRLEEELVQRLLAVDQPAEAGDIYGR